MVDRRDIGMIIDRERKNSILPFINLARLPDFCPKEKKDAEKCWKVGAKEVDHYHGVVDECF